MCLSGPLSPGEALESQWQYRREPNRYDAEVHASTVYFLLSSSVSKKSGYTGTVHHIISQWGFPTWIYEFNKNIYFSSSYKSSQIYFFVKPQNIDKNHIFRTSLYFSVIINAVLSILKSPVQAEPDVSVSWAAPPFTSVSKKCVTMSCSKQGSKKCLCVSCSITVVMIRHISLCHTVPPSHRLNVTLKHSIYGVSWSAGCGSQVGRAKCEACRGMFVVYNIFVKSDLRQQQKKHVLWSSYYSESRCMTKTMFRGRHLKPRFSCKWCSLNI